MHQRIVLNKVFDMIEQHACKELPFLWNNRLTHKIGASLHKKSRSGYGFQLMRKSCFNLNSYFFTKKVIKHTLADRLNEGKIIVQVRNYERRKNI